MPGQGEEMAARPQLKLLRNSANKCLLTHLPSNVQAQADLMVEHLDF